MTNSATTWTAAHQASLSFTISWNLLKLMSIESVMPSNHLFLCHPWTPAFNLSQHQGLFQWTGYLHHAPKYRSFSISPSNEYLGLISFRSDWFDLAVQRTLKSLLQHHNWKTSILQCSAFFMVHLSHSYVTTWKTIVLTIQTFVG